MKKPISIIISLFFIANAMSQNADTFRQWGNEIMHVIDQNFRGNSYSYLYNEDRDVYGVPAFAWPMGIQLKALIYAGRINDAKGLYNEFHSNYYYEGDGYGAYNAVCHKQDDRYYDDNAWIAKDLLDLYDVTGDNFFLERAKLINIFCMSGERAEGGIRFHENYSDPLHEEHNSWATCSTAPVACVNLRIFQITNEPDYLQNGMRLYQFMKDEGWGIGYGFRGYENAVIMQAALLLFQITDDDTYLMDAYRIAYSMEAHYVEWQTRRLNEIGCWGGHDMTDAYVALYNIDKDTNWLNIVAGYLTYLHDNCMDNNGYYPEEWYDTEKNGKRFHLLDQASVACAFLKMASTPGGAVKLHEPVAVFQDINWNYEGIINRWSLGLNIGNYTKDDLAFFGSTDNRFKFNKAISSVRVADNYQLILYDEDNFDGNSIEYTQDADYLHQWNDRAVSLQVISLLPIPLTVTEREAECPVKFYQYTNELCIENLSGQSEINVFDLNGTLHFKIQTTNNFYKIPTSLLSKGLYILYINHNGQYKTWKFQQ